jgi:flavin reductase (DIM6/NTAB) family NADH-FMN oxidoreductase RutF
MTLTSHFPLLITISVGNGEEDPGSENYRASYVHIQKTNEFGLNIPSSEPIESVAKIGTLHSNQAEKFTETGLTPWMLRRFICNGTFSEKYRSKHNQIHLGDVIDL